MYKENIIKIYIYIYIILQSKHTSVELRMESLYVFIERRMSPINVCKTKIKEDFQIKENFP